MAHTTLIDGQKSISLTDADAFRDVFGWNSVESSGGLGAEKAVTTVGYVARCLDLRAGAVASMPWTLTKGETQTATSEEFDNLPWLRNIRNLLYLTEAAQTSLGVAYWYKVRNARNAPLRLRWFAPDTMTPEWDAVSGIVGFKRQLGAQSMTLNADDVIYFSLPNPFHETEPGTAPVATALADAGVIYNSNQFAEAFFKRGAIRATVLTVDGPVAESERDRLKSWWNRAFSGIGKAFGTEVFTNSINPVVIGDGLAELSNSELTNEKREAISTAMGVPHSLVMSNAANFATAESDRLNFYDTTIVPATQRIEEEVNAQLFEPMGLKFKFNPNTLKIYQEDEEQRAQSFQMYVSSGMAPSIAAEMLGLNLPQGVEYSELDEAMPDPTPEPAPVAVADAQADAENAQKRAEASQFRKWCKRRYRPDLSKFRADHLSFDEKKAIAAEYVEDGAADDATFPVPSWESYP